MSAARADAAERFLAAHAGEVASLCAALAERFQAGGRLLAVGGSPQAWSDAHHVAVEFVHPVIVGKRALPALAVAPHDLALLRQPADAVVTFEPLALETDERHALGPADDDPFVAQEVAETVYHVLWELVHVFLEHDVRAPAGSSGAAAGFLYPFLDAAATELGPLLDDVRRSALAKAAEVSALRTATLEENGAVLAAAATAVRDALDAGGTVLAFGNGGSATDAMDLVADLRGAPQGWRPRRALDLSGDPAILTALANDIGPGSLFARQLIAYGRAGDVAVAFSTSGGSANILEALAEARRRGLVTVAFVGYDGGRIAADGLADHVVVTRSEHIPRIQEAQATAYHALLERLEALTTRAG